MDGGESVAISIKSYCPADDCRYFGNCCLNKSFQDGGTYGPVIDVRLINQRVTVQCFSYISKEGRNGKENDRQRKEKEG